MNVFLQRNEYIMGDFYASLGKVLLNVFLQRNEYIMGELYSVIR